MIGRIGDDTTFAINYFRIHFKIDFISIGLSNSNYLNTIDLSARTI